MPLVPTGRDISVLEKYIRSQAVRDALKAILPFAQEVIDEKKCLTYAKACYARKAISKSGVDLSEDRDLPLPHRNTTFLTSMFRSLEHDYINFETVCEVLRGFPEVVVVAEKMEEEYERQLVEWDLPKYQKEPVIIYGEEATAAFKELCAHFERMWLFVSEAIRDRTPFKELKQYMSYSYVDAKEEVLDITDTESLIIILRTKVDLLTTTAIESIAVEQKYYDVLKAVEQYHAAQILYYSRVLITQFAHDLATCPEFVPLRPNATEDIRIQLNWDKETATMLDYYYMMEVTYSALARHYYLYEVDPADLTFKYKCPKWVLMAMCKLSREKTYALHERGVGMVSVGMWITVENPRWGITDPDRYEYMNNMLRISRGLVNTVFDEIEGTRTILKRKKAEHKKMLESYHQSLQGQPAPFLLAPFVFEVPNYQLLLSHNLPWISPPFYTGPRGYKFAMIVYPGGFASGKGNHISVFAMLMRGEFDDELHWPFAGCISMVMITHPYDEDRNYDEDFDFNPKARPNSCERVVVGDFAPQAIGSQQFMAYEYMSWNDRDEAKFIADDTIRFKILETYVEP